MVNYVLLETVPRGTLQDGASLRCSEVFGETWEEFLNEWVDLEQQHREACWKRWGNAAFSFNRQSWCEHSQDMTAVGEGCTPFYWSLINSDLSSESLLKIDVKWFRIFQTWAVFDQIWRSIIIKQLLAKYSLFSCQICFSLGWRKTNGASKSSGEDPPEPSKLRNMMQHLLPCCPALNQAVMLQLFAWNKPSNPHHITPRAQSRSHHLHHDPS